MPAPAPVHIEAPAPAPVHIEAPAPAPVRVAPAPVNQYIPPAAPAPAPVHIEAPVRAAPAPVLAPQPVLEEIEPISADGYRYKTQRRRVIRRRL